jgi:DNA-binding transcriptional ArsR family regulator
MVERLIDIDLVFQALAHEVRRDILAHLASGESSVGELAEPFAMSLAAVSKHVSVLERAGLVDRRLVGRRHVCRLVPEPLATAFGWLGFYQEFWDKRLDALDALFPTGAATTDTTATTKGKQ